MKLRYSARTDVGRTRDHNEDNFGLGEGHQVESLGYLFVVCDGMGGHAAGEVASQIGVEMVIRAYYETEGDDRADALDRAFDRANLSIHAEGRGSMGTTGVAALVYRDVLYVANVGDSRAYLIRGGAIHQITRDHSLVSDQIAAGLITAEQARTLNYRNVITRALGYQPDVAIDMFRWPLQPGDRIVLSSDGLHGLVEDEEIRQHVSDQPIEAAVDALIALANERGGTDNITLIIVVVDQIDWQGLDDDEEVARGFAADPAAITQPVPILQPAPPAPPAADPMPQAKYADDTLASATTQELAPPVQAAQSRNRTLIGVGLAALLLIILVGIVLFTSPTPAPTPPPTVAPPPTRLVEPTRSAELPRPSPTQP
ncbi:MAG: protein phosphatase 2C domain-containing protein [Roseiflexaceae bacterium]